jgi:hypothetical protein
MPFPEVGESIPRLLPAPHTFIVYFAPLTQVSELVLFISRFSKIILYSFRISPNGPAHLILLEFVTMNAFGKESKLRDKNS